MLYDPKWEDPMSTTRIIGWLASMPSAEKYEYMDCAGACLWDQYLRAVGMDRWAENIERDAFHKAGAVFGALHQEPYHLIAKSEPQTFGAALERARAALVAD